MIIVTNAIHLKLGKPFVLILNLKIDLLSEKFAEDSKHFCFITMDWTGPTPYFLLTNETLSQIGERSLEKNLIRYCISQFIKILFILTLIDEVFFKPPFCDFLKLVKPFEHLYLSPLGRFDFDRQADFVCFNNKIDFNAHRITVGAYFPAFFVKFVEVNNLVNMTLVSSIFPKQHQLH